MSIEPEAAVPIGPIRRLTVEQYRAMARAGILTPDDDVELLEGWLVEKMTKNPPHRVATRRTRVALEAVAPTGWYVDSQEPIATADSEPEPDVAVIRGRTEDYPDTNPDADNVTLVVEVADVSLMRDRQTKARIYAKAGIATYWIVNLEDRAVEVMTDPGGSAAPTYGSCVAVAEGDEVPLIVEGVEVGRVAVEAMLPPRKTG